MRMKRQWLRSKSNKIHREKTSVKIVSTFAMARTSTRIPHPFLETANVLIRRSIHTFAFLTNLLLQKFARVILQFLFESKLLFHIPCT